MYPKGSIMKQIKILFLAIALWGSMGTLAHAVPPCNGCDCSLDDNNVNNDSPGVAIPGIDGTTGDISTCFSGDSLNIAGNPAYKNSRDMYYFTVQTEGILTISMSSPNNKPYASYIGIRQGQRDIKSWTTESSWSRQVILHSGDGAYFYIRGKRGEGTVEYQVDLNFTAGIPIHATDNDYVTSPGQSISGNLITEDTGDGTDIGGTGFGLTDPGSPSLGTITSWDSNGSFTYTPDSNVTSGTDTFSYTITDAQGETDTATVSIIIASTAGRPFSLRKLYNIKGNMKMIGNSVMLGPNGALGSNNGSCVATNKNNSDVNMVFADMDNDGTTVNSTSAHIALPNNVRANDIQFVGLYWQGRFIRQNIPASAEQVQLKLPNESSYAPATADVSFDTILNSAPPWRYNDYQGISDITNRFKKAMGSTAYSGDVWVADVQANTTNNSFGAWMMILVYKDKNAHTKNISIYDGFQNLGANNPLAITLSGFKTPKIADVDSRFFIFGGEGDVLWDHDSVSLTKKDGSPVPLGTNIFSSSLLRNGANVTDRSPSCTNTIGIDIKDFSVGQPNGDYPIIGHDQNSTTVNLTAPWETHTTNSGQTFNIYDQIFPGMFAFAADLYIPDICYDYTIQQGGFDITDSSDGNRSFKTIGRDKVTINLAIKSEEGDFDFEYSKLNLMVDPATDISFDRALYAPNTVNTFVPAIYSEDHSSIKPSIALGENPNTSGGTIKALQRYFSKFEYDPQTDYYSGRFEFELNTTINFGSGPVPLLFSSSEGGIDRCAQSKIYKPIYGTFNVERHNSSGNPDQKYPLYTQTTGKDFDFDVVAYKKDPAPAYSTELPLNGYTVDVELINVRPFNDVNATFTCTNPDPAVVQTLTAAGDKDLFAKFNGSSRVDMSSLNIQTNAALRNAAFRVWYLVDENGTILPHTCADPSDNSCFETLYNTHLKSSDTQGFCSDCSNYVSTERNAEGCYACLRDHFAKAVCSRDNFSIRPASYRLMLSDSNESNDSSTPALSLGNNNSDKTNTSPVASVAAGYQYKLEGNATSFISDNTRAKGYRRLFNNRDTDNLLSTLLFKDNTSNCYDQNNTNWNVYFENGKIVGIMQGNSIHLNKGNLVKHSNVGIYAYHLHDSNWTLVDQQRYAYKTFPGVDDCIPNNNSITTNSSGRSGCDIDSKLTTNNATYNDLYLRYQPYRFDLSSINLSTDPQGDYLFMTDFDDPYYSTGSSLSDMMAAIYEGNVTARAKGGKITTNFTNGCAAMNLTIVLHRKADPSEENLTNNYGIQMQQYLQYGSNLNLIDKVLGKDANLTLAKAAFEDIVTPGSARVKIPTTFKKPKKKDILDGSEGINPIRVNYLDANAFSVDANSTAHKSLHIPGGAKNFDKNVTFVYGRIAPKKKLYVTDKNSTNTPLYVFVYCDKGPAICQNYDLNSTIGAEGITANWYTPESLFNTPNTAYGDIDMNNHHYSGKQTPIKLSEGSDFILNDTTGILDDRHFDVLGHMSDLNVSMQNPAYSNRPATVTIGYYPPPWLLYYKDSKPTGSPKLDADKPNEKAGKHKGFYRVRFIPKPTAWTGYGKTGHVVGDKANGDDINFIKTKRLEW